MANEQTIDPLPRPENTGKVRIQRWPTNGPVVGPSLMMLSLAEAASALAESGFMRPWIESKIAEEFLGGGSFTNHAKVVTDDEPAIVANGEQVYLRIRSEYRMATPDEVLNFADTAQYSTATGRVVSKRAQEKGYILHYHEGSALIESYDKLPRQAKVIMDVLNDAGRDNFTEASIAVLLEKAVEMQRLVTRQDPMGIFAYYRGRLIDEGHLEEVGEE